MSGLVNVPEYPPGFPMPLPISVSVTSVSAQVQDQDTGQVSLIKMAALQIAHAQGINVFFFPEDVCKLVGTSLIEIATGIQVVKDMPDMSNVHLNGR